MGYGDYLHWTAIVRDLYNDINKENKINDKLSKINYYIDKFKNFKKYGVSKFKMNNETDDFKIMLNQKNKNIDVIFLNNPYITFKDYPNIIYLNIVSVGYRKGNKCIDDKHVIETYCENIGIKNYKVKTELFFTKKEKLKVKKLIPNEDFILIEPNQHKIGRQYPFEKFQNIVNSLYKKIKFIQVSPLKFGCKYSKKLSNVTLFIGNLSFRENIYFSKFAKLSLIHEGGISIGSDSVNAKCIVISNAAFNPKMTIFQNQIPIYVHDENHNSCGIITTLRNWEKNNPKKIGCLQCFELMKNHDEKIIINLINKYL